MYKDNLIIRKLKMNHNHSRIEHFICSWKEFADEIYSFNKQLDKNIFYSQNDNSFICVKTLNNDHYEIINSLKEHFNNNQHFCDKLLKSAFENNATKFEYKLKN